MPLLLSTQELEFAEWNLLLILTIAILAAPIWLVLGALPPFSPNKKEAKIQITLYILGWAFAFGFAHWDPWHTIARWLS